MEYSDSNLNSLLKSAYWIAGPTASGKTHLAIKLAEQIQAEIVSVDSMQVYQGMDIGTAKPSSDELAAVPHHMIDVVDLNESYDAARFRQEALRAAADVHQRGRKVIFCGGTGLYFQALIHGIGKGPPSDESVRRDLEDLSIEELRCELKESDPHTYEEIDLHNKRRLIRALEVFRLTGRSFASFKSDWKRSSIIDPSRFCVLVRPAEVLRKRIHDRVLIMIQAGWIEETKQLLNKGLRQNSTANQAIGYRQIVEYLEGTWSLDEMIQSIQNKTWQFAKRQRTWFRHQIKNRPVHLEGDRPEYAFKEILSD